MIKGFVIGVLVVLALVFWMIYLFVAGQTSRGFSDPTGLVFFVIGCGLAVTAILAGVYWR